MAKCNFNDKLQGYHFTECGLDYVYLLNGYELVQDPLHGEIFSLHDSDSLFREIARTITLHKKELSYQDMRFLRKEMGLTQRQAADLLSVGLRQYQRYEKKDGEEIPRNSQDFMRIMYWDFHNDRGSISEKIKNLREERDSKQTLHMQLLGSKEGWKEAA
jgi:DNA-binding transcriptional regulator YiaG